VSSVERSVERWVHGRSPTYVYLIFNSTHPLMKTINY
jgi:hypothetical protein